MAFAAIPIILALYVLKVRGAPKPVGALTLWPTHLADRQANAPWKRLRASRLLLVQLLVAALAAAALVRPGLVGAAGVAGTTVVLIDGSASMRATDVAPSRFLAAVARARARADHLGRGQQMAVILLGAHARLLAAPTGDPTILRSALARAHPSGEAADLSEGLSLANAILAGRPAASVVLYSDGHARPPEQAMSMSAPLHYESIGTKAGNATVEALERLPDGNVAVRVANWGPTARDLKVELRADGRLVDVVPLRVDAGSRADATWAGLPDGTTVLEARLNPPDHLTLDDAAWLITKTPAPRRVLLATPGNDFLARALKLRDDLDVTVVDPPSYRPGAFDLFVFDGFVPDGPLPGPALVIDPPEGRGPVPAGPQIDPGAVSPTDPREPLLQYVSLNDVHVQSAASVSLPPGWRTVVPAANGPLLIVHQGEPRTAQVTFDLHRSDLPLRRAFPILVQNLVTALMPGGFENQTLPLGRPVTLTAAAGATEMEVSSPDGRQFKLTPPFPRTAEDTASPGVYTVRERGPGLMSTRHFVVQLADPRQSDISPAAGPMVRLARRSSGPAPPSTLEIWPWVAAVLFLALIVECLVFLRG